MLKGKFPVPRNHENRKEEVLEPREARGERSEVSIKTGIEILPGVSIALSKWRFMISKILPKGRPCYAIITITPCPVGYKFC